MNCFTKLLKEIQAWLDIGLTATMCICGSRWVLRMQIIVTQGCVTYHTGDSKKIVTQGCVTYHFGDSK